jgi:hypothetical protein
LKIITSILEQFTHDVKRWEGLGKSLGHLVTHLIILETEKRLDVMGQMESLLLQVEME